MKPVPESDKNSPAGNKAIRRFNEAMAKRQAEDEAVYQRDVMGPLFEGEWLWDAIMRGWRFVIVWEDGQTYQTAAVYKQGKGIEFALRDELRRKREGKPVRFQQVSEHTFTLPACL